MVLSLVSVDPGLKASLSWSFTHAVGFVDVPHSGAPWHRLLSLCPVGPCQAAESSEGSWGRGLVASAHTSFRLGVSVVCPELI